MIRAAFQTGQLPDFSDGQTIAVQTPSFFCPAGGHRYLIETAVDKYCPDCGYSEDRPMVAGESMFSANARIIPLNRTFEDVNGPTKDQAHNQVLRDLAQGTMPVVML